MSRKIKVVITTTLICTEDQFHSIDVQELINDIKSGETRRNLKKGPVSDATITYWTDYKNQSHDKE